MCFAKCQIVRGNVITCITQLTYSHYGKRVHNPAIIIFPTKMYLQLLSWMQSKDIVLGDVSDFHTCCWSIVQKEEEVHTYS